MAIAIVFSGGIATASGVFDGSADYLVVADDLVGSTPDYPVLVGCWVNLDNVTVAHTFFMGSDNAAIGALDAMIASVSGSTANDPVLARSYAAGATSVAQQNGGTAGTWIFVGNVYRSASDRSGILGTTVGTAETTSRATTGLTHAAIGAQYFNSGATINVFLDGKVGEWFIASGFTIGDLATILTSLNAGTRPISVAELSPHIDAYQPLRTGLNDSGFVGPTWTNVGVTFDADHPIVYSSGLLKAMMLHHHSILTPRKRVPILHDSSYAIAP